MTVIRILSFDIGIKHTAWSIVSYDSDHLLLQKEMKPTTINLEILHQIVDIERFDLWNPFQTDMHSLYVTLHQLLRSMMPLWQTVDVILIEQQMSTRSSYNIKAIKVSQHIYAFFLSHYPDKQVREYQPHLKTSVFQVRFNRTYDRKQWSIQQVTSFLESDPVALDWFQCYTKKDDIADSILMGIVFIWSRICHG